MVKNPMRVWDVENLSLGTLAQDTAILANTKIDDSRFQGCVPREVDYHVDFVGKTVNEGPIAIGLSVGMTIAEISEYFLADPQRLKDPADAEKSQRPVLVLDVLGRRRTASLELPWLTKKWPGWWVREQVGLDVFAFNFGAALTTGTNATVTMQIRGDWLND